MVSEVSSVGDEEDAQDVVVNVLNEGGSMRHVVLTCKNHPELRWSTKEIAVCNGKYTGARNIFFMGKTYTPPRFHSDMSGVECENAYECSCSSGDLEVAPEDNQIKQ